MQLLTIPYPDDLLLVTGQTPRALEHELRFWLAVKLFELTRLTLGQAAEMAGMSKWQFGDELGRWGIPIINLTDDQIASELHDDH